MKRSSEFYASGKGDRLIDRANYSVEVRDYLRREREALRDMLRVFDVLVEVGCMHGRHLDDALDVGCAYVGIDPVDRYIASGHRRCADEAIDSRRARFVCADAADLVPVIADAARGVWGERVLVFLPFNCFGNIQDPTRTLDALAVGMWPFFISAFRTTCFANAHRASYYANCGYDGVRGLPVPDGVRFVSDDGLDTTAYHPAVVTEWFLRRGVHVRVRGVARVGLAFVAARGSELPIS